MRAAPGAARAAQRPALRAVLRVEPGARLRGLRRARRLPGLRVARELQRALARLPRRRRRGRVAASARRRTRARALDALAGPGARSAPSSCELFSMAAAGERARLVELLRDRRRASRSTARSRSKRGRGRRAAQRARCASGAGSGSIPSLLRSSASASATRSRSATARFPVQGAIARDGGRPTSGFSIAPRVYLALDRSWRRRSSSRPAAASSTGACTGSRPARRTRSRARCALALRRRRSSRCAPTTRRRGELSRAYARVARRARAGRARGGLPGRRRRRASVPRLPAAPARRRGDPARARRDAAPRRAGLPDAARAAGRRGGPARQRARRAAAARARARSRRDFLPPGFAPRVGWRAVAVVALLAAAGGVATCLPLLLRLRELRPAQLFAEGARPALAPRRRATRRWAWLPAARALLGDLPVAGAEPRHRRLVRRRSSPRRSRCWPRWASCCCARWRRCRRRAALAPRLALRELARGRGSGALLLRRAGALRAAPGARAAAARVARARSRGARRRRRCRASSSSTSSRSSARRWRSTSRRATRRAGRASRRSCARGSTAIAASRSATRATATAPPARARVARDAEDDARRLRSRGYNLTYRDALAPGERLLAGRPFSRDARRRRHPPRSRSRSSFAERLGVGVGDTLDFDVQGVPVEGRVVSLREVRWQSFEPNFFVLFQPGVLEEAPQTFLASVPQLPPDAARGAPGLARRGVPERLERGRDAHGRAPARARVAQLEWALTGTAALSLAVGLAVVYAIARDQARARRRETNLLKVLGADFRAIRAALDLEYGTLGALAALAGSSVCAVASALLARYVLDVPWTPAPCLCSARRSACRSCVVAARSARPCARGAGAARAAERRIPASARPRARAASVCATDRPRGRGCPSDRSRAGRARRASGCALREPTRARSGLPDARASAPSLACCDGISRSASSLAARCGGTRSARLARLRLARVGRLASASVLSGRVALANRSRSGCRRPPSARSRAAPRAARRARRPVACGRSVAQRLAHRLEVPARLRAAWRGSARASRRPRRAGRRPGSAGCGACRRPPPDACARRPRAAAAR